VARSTTVSPVEVEGLILIILQYCVTTENPSCNCENTSLQYIGKVVGQDLYTKHDPHMPRSSGRLILLLLDTLLYFTTVPVIEKTHFTIDDRPVDEKPPYSKSRGVRLGIFEGRLLSASAPLLTLDTKVFDLRQFFCREFQIVLTWDESIFEVGRQCGWS
jgi:hypothetical protein